MPLLLLIPAALAAIATVNLTTKANGDSIFTPAEGATPSFGLPSWVIPTAVVVIGGILLYKEGRKILKV